MAAQLPSISVVAARGERPSHKGAVWDNTSQTPYMIARIHPGNHRGDLRELVISILGWYGMFDASPTQGGVVFRAEVPRYATSEVLTKQLHEDLRLGRA